MLRYPLLAFFAVLANLLTNIIAAIIQQSVGQLTGEQVVIACITTFLVFLVFHWLEEHRARRLRKNDELVAEKIDQVRSCRRKIEVLDQRHESGLKWGESEIKEWQNCQTKIMELKRELRGIGNPIEDDPIDFQKPYPLRFKSIRSFFQLIMPTLMLPLIFVGSLVATFFLTPGVHSGYLTYIATPTPIINPVPTSTPNPTPTILVQTITPTPVPTEVPVPTPTFIPSPTLTPTPQQYLGQILLSTMVSVYDSPTGENHASVSTLKSGTKVFVCAQAGDRYLVALQPCYASEPVGWVKMRNVSPPTPPIPDSLVTPLPPTSTVAKTPTPLLPANDVQWNLTSGPCLGNPNANARITDVVIDNDELVIYGVATRSDFKSYLMYWRSAAQTELPVESGERFDFDRAVSREGRLQDRPLDELYFGSAYLITLRILGTANGQYQDCTAYVEIPGQ